MHLIDQTPYQSKDGTFTFAQRVQATLDMGGAWYRDVMAQRDALVVFERILDNRFILLRNIALPGVEVRIPLILVGPTGIWVLNVSGLRGVYRAKEDAWTINTGGQFKRAKPNLIQRVELYARSLEAHLYKSGLPAAAVKPALLFTDPGLHVDVANASVRVVMSDALDRFLSGVMQDRSELSAMAIQDIVHKLTRLEQVKEVSLEDGIRAEDDDFFSYGKTDEEREQERLAQREQRAQKITSAFQLSTRQWVALGVLFGFEVLILFGFLIYILFF